MRYRFAVLVGVLLLSVLAALPAGAAPGVSSPAACAKVASSVPLWLDAVATKVTYCYDTRAACDNAQKQASGTKSACYKSGNQYCYDLFPTAADPGPVEP